MPAVQVTDVILRDAHQSLIATRMRTADMLPACTQLDHIGFWSLEVWGGATFDACLRFLKEDPWERLRQLRHALPNTRLQMLLRGQNLLGYRHYPDDVVQAFVALAAGNGIDVFRIFDALNDTRNLATATEAVRASGKHAQGTICYTTSPVHSTASFVAMARELEAMGCDSIAIKDMAGLLTPMVTAELVSGIKAATAIPLQLHCHATAGTAEMCLLKAVENGCDRIDTAISSFSGSTSHAATESMVAALQGSGFATGLDLEALQEIALHFREVRSHYRQFESEYHDPDTRVQVYQVPGGMISNLHTQLRDQGALDRLDEVLQEIPRVRQDLGYPPLVTPTSQIVGTQAVINVLTGKRYDTITNEVKLYLQGRYGRAPAMVDPEVRRKAIGAAQEIDVRPADLLGNEMGKLRTAIGDLAESEEDVLTCAMFPEIGKDFLKHRKQGTLVAETPAPPPAADATGAGERRSRPTEFNVTLHGEPYHIKITGTGHRTLDNRPFYLTVDGVPEEVLVEVLDEIPATSNGQPAPVQDKGSRRPRATQPGHVTASMPGTIIDVLVTPGQQVTAGTPLLITEAMKMETEIQAPVSGCIKAIHVSKGDRVNPDETLIEIDEAD
jgi:pyruvate carboxylase subunit B